jgi:hypothetical protein
MKKPINVIYIGGSGRSGSTVLTKILNFWNGLIGLNEVCYLWKYGIKANHPVSNGDLFHESPFWTKVLEKTFPGHRVEREDVDFFAHSSQVGIGNMIKENLRKSPPEPAVTEYSRNLERLYRNILEVSGSQFIVDSSKTPDYAYFLSGIKSVDMVLIHLVRDPRGVAYSWSKRFKREDVGAGAEVNMTSFGLIKSTLRWMKWNVGCEVVRRRKNVRYLRVRYEDFTQNPSKTLDQLAALLGLSGDSPMYHLTPEGFRDRSGAKDVSIWGNPQVRMSSGPIKIAEDNAWVKELEMGKKLAVTLLTLPLLIRYGYRIF